MTRVAFVMSVNRGAEEEYRRRHDALWPEMRKALKEHGVRNYSIFFHPVTSQLFAYAEVEDVARWKEIASTEVCRRWWAHMKDIMPANPDNSPVSEPLVEVFHLD